MSERQHIKRKMPLPLKIVLVFLSLVIVAVGSTVGYNVYQNKNFTVSFYQINTDKVTSNIRIVELSDLHDCIYGEKNSKLIEKIRSLKPDLIFYAGDMIEEKTSDYSVLFDLSDELYKIAPIFACYGNNELDQQLFYDNQFADKLEEHNVTLLSNEATDITVNNTVIQLIVETDNLKQYDVKTNNGKKFIDSLTSTEYCRVCLTHYPELFNEKLLNKGIDIAFTGHAHGGHIRIPHFGGLYSTGEGFLPRFTAGVVEADDGTQVVVSRGLSNNETIPRINNQPELVVVDICWY